MSLVLVLIALGGWQVEETALVSGPWKVGETAAIDDTAVGVIGIIPSTADAGDSYFGPPPAVWGVFVARPGQAPLLLARFDQRASERTGAGTGFTVAHETDAGVELFRVRSGAVPALVSLGEFEGDVEAVSCDAAVSVCVVAERESSTTLWKSDGSRVELAGELSIRGAAVNPPGTFAGLALEGSAALLSLDAGTVTVMRANETWKRPSLAAFSKDVMPKGRLAKAWDRAGERCTTVPQGWEAGKLLVAHASAMQDIGSDDTCGLPAFQLDPVSGKRSPLPVYPWQALDCPRGGWTSSVGTFVTQCMEEISFRIRGTKPRRLEDGATAKELESEWADIGMLPEAIALSENQIFVMPSPKKTRWQWFRGKPTGKGLEFILQGPSVIEFNAKGVVVEQLAGWRWGEAIFETPLDDDWHLISTGGRRGQHALVRITAQ